MLQIVTDSASDITLAQAKEMNIHIVPLSIHFSDGECPQETDADFEIFYHRLATCQELPQTSQPSPEAYLEIYEAAKRQGDDVLVLTLSGGLSGTAQTAASTAALSGYDRIFVVDTHQAILSQRLMVEQAVRMREQGMPVEEIAAAMVTIRDKVTVSGVVDTLVNLRKGGRIPASLALLGEAIRIKPVIALQGTILQTIGKALGRKAGIRMLYERIEKYPPDPAYPIYFGYTADRELGLQFMQETIEKCGLQHLQACFYPVGGVIGTHVGNNCLAVCYVAKEEIL